MLLFFIAFIILICLVQLNSQKHALKGIKYEYEFSKKLIEIDEETELISLITNESHRLIPFIRMIEAFPRGIKPLNQSVYLREDAFNDFNYNSSIYLMARSRLQRKLKFTFDKRGRYVFRGATLYGGDFLGLKETREKFEQLRELVVYPKPIAASHLQDILGGFLGDMSVRRFIMEDPILTIGTRVYTGREPLKQLSWKHTARTNQMMVKQFDYTTEMVVTVFLDISPVKGRTLRFEQLENCFSLARTVCQYFDQKRIPFAFVSNALIEGINEDNHRLVKGLGQAHLRAILERLGRASYGTRETYEALIKKLALNQEQNRSTVIITPLRDAYKQSVSEQLKEKTTGVLLFIYGEDFDDVS